MQSNLWYVPFLTQEQVNQVKKFEELVDLQLGQHNTSHGFCKCDACPDFKTWTPLQALVRAQNWAEARRIVMKHFPKSFVNNGIQVNQSFKIPPPSIKWAPFGV